MNDNHVLVKVSICQKCNKIFCAAIMDKMTDESKTKFLNEVFDNNLSVKQMTLGDYRYGNEKSFCDCAQLGAGSCVADVSKCNNVSYPPKTMKDQECAQEKTGNEVLPPVSCSVVKCGKAHYDVYIGRPSKWGNPFTHLNNGKTLAKFVVGSRDEAVKSYREWITNGDGKHLIKDLPELKNKVLGCWCKPLSCHGDVLSQLVSEYCN